MEVTNWLFAILKAAKNDTVDLLVEMIFGDLKASEVQEIVCAHWTGVQCVHELIPGCSSATGVTVPKSTPDQCCAHWMADGKCAHELIPGCSN